jgi:hypothetical protein
MKAREREVMELTGRRERYHNWLQLISSNMVPRYTERGFDLVKTPLDVQKKLRKIVKDGLKQWDELEPEKKDGKPLESLYGNQAKFIKIDGKTIVDIATELLPLHEEWAGIKLVPTSVYGVRMYQNGSALAMHVDNVDSHIISSIVHIAHKYDNKDEPWPIHIEDHDGNMHAHSLKAGEMLFYESAACVHGRMRQFKGSYYGSLFVHYRPVEWNTTIIDVHHKLPRYWDRGTTEERGSRKADLSMTIDSLAAYGAPDRVVNGKYIHSDVSVHAQPPSRHLDSLYDEL